jgi:hypothetical protein
MLIENVSSVQRLGCHLPGTSRLRPSTLSPKEEPAFSAYLILLLLTPKLSGNNEGVRAICACLKQNVPPASQPRLAHMQCTPHTEGDREI